MLELRRRMMSQKKRLPSGYTEHKAINHYASRENAGINTPWQFGVDFDELHMVVQNNYTGSSTYIYGNGQIGSNNPFNLLISDGYICKSNGFSLVYLIKFVTGVEYSVVHTKTYIQIDNNPRIYNSKYAIPRSCLFAFFSAFEGGIGYHSMPRLSHDIDMYLEDELVHKLVICTRDVDDRIGLYDIIGDTFLPVNNNTYWVVED